jgi:uncharacterized protein (TIGR00296 family)
MISEEEGKRLLQLAREAVESVLKHSDLDVDSYCEQHFGENQGCFVTLHKDGELRGCIGFPEPIMPLYKAIVQAAQAAALQDPRFPPVDAEEFEKLDFEVSVLTKPQLVKVKNSQEYLNKVNIGSDGLIIRGSGGSGLLLPQVATEYGWTAKEFLQHTCLKAGLSQDDWKDLRNEIYSFQAQIFKETKE